MNPGAQAACPKWISHTRALPALLKRCLNSRQRPDGSERPAAVTQSFRSGQSCCDHATTRAARGTPWSYTRASRDGAAVQMKTTHCHEHCHAHANNRPPLTMVARAASSTRRCIGGDDARWSPWSSPLLTRSDRSLFFFLSFGFASASRLGQDWGNLAPSRLSRPAPAHRIVSYRKSITPRPKRATSNKRHAPCICMESQRASTKERSDLGMRFRGLSQHLGILPVLPVLPALPSQNLGPGLQGLHLSYRGCQSITSCSHGVRMRNASSLIPSFPLHSPRTRFLRTRPAPSRNCPVG